MGQPKPPSTRTCNLVRCSPKRRESNLYGDSRRERHGHGFTRLLSVNSRTGPPRRDSTSPTPGKRGWQRQEHAALVAVPWQELPSPAGCMLVHITHPSGRHRLGGRHAIDCRRVAEPRREGKGGGRLAPPTSPSPSNTLHYLAIRSFN